MTRGQLTGSKTNVIGTSDMLWGVNYYDMDGRVVRSFKQHYKGGTVAAGNYDEVSNTYDFTGAVLSSNRSHKVGSTETLKSLTEYTYDHRGRKLDTWQTMNTGTRTLLSRMEYDDLGQPYKKKLHSTNSGSSFLQTVTYGYTERSWLKTASAPLLSFELRYNSPSRGAGAQYNGNISEFEYTAPTSGNKWFTYSYDNLNRLMESAYSTASELNESIQYDKNGNITWLRRGLSSTTPITYVYSNSGNSNQLSSVSGLKVGGFSYDGNGNTLTDGMRGVSTAYNQLNLPSTITNIVTSNISATYTYDGTGNKLRSMQGSLTTDYISGVHYKNNVLSFMSTDEGRVVRNPSTGAYTYEYSLRDHLGNSRVSFDDNAGTARLIQEDEFYAFGLVSSKIVFGDKNNYLYNGKELQTALADVYDYGARFYDPVIGRWNVVDPLAEKYNLISPYNYTDNNPVNNTDPDGRYVLYGAEAQALFGALKDQPYNRPSSFKDDPPSDWFKMFGIPMDFFENFMNYARNELNHLRNRGRSYESALKSGNHPSVVDDQYEYDKAVLKLKLLGDGVELYGFNVAALEASAGGLIWSEGLLRGGGQFAFHSGNGTAEAAAKAGFKTLGQTRAGKNLAKLTEGMVYKRGSEAYKMWERLSIKYAESFPKGSTVHVFINNPSQTGIWLNVEKKIMEQRGINIITHTVK